tara:strand:- start:92 stop:631 length:540 start_codon:yes stop_codon:yes gene_type:complete
MFSFTYILIKFFQLDRFILTINNTSNDIDSVVEKYKDTKKHNSSENIVLYFILNRPIDEFIPVLCSVLDQTIRIDRITILDNVGYTKQNKHRDKLEKYINIVQWKNPKVSTDTIKKLEKDKNTRIIVLRDDIIYGTDFIEFMINNNSCIDSQSGCFSITQDENKQNCIEVEYDGNNYEI